MKPSQIHEILDLTRAARANNDKFNPLFVGPPGIGKSEIIQQWCAEKGLPFIDLRAAYLEAPDMIGFPTVGVVNGRQVTQHNLPEFWPQDGEGVILLEEPNRGTTSVMNTFMQVLTDRKVHTYTLPKGWIIVGAINPESEENDVNTMDAALKNRFEMFNVEYDAESFIQFMKDDKWDERIVHFVRGNFWTYVKPEDVASNPGVKYISPRSLSKLNAALKAGVTDRGVDIQMLVFESTLGKNYAIQFMNFISKERPVFVRDLLDDSRDAFERLARFSDPDNYKNGHISMLIEDMKSQEAKITDELLAQVVTTIPSDQAVLLIRELEFLRKMKSKSLLKKLSDEYPKVKKYLAKNLTKE